MQISLNIQIMGNVTFLQQINKKNDIKWTFYILKPLRLWSARGPTGGSKIPIIKVIVKLNNLRNSDVHIYGIIWKLRTSAFLSIPSLFHLCYIKSESAPPTHTNKLPTLVKIT